MVSVPTSPWWVGSTCLRGALGTWCGNGCANCAWCPIKGGALGGQSTQADSDKPVFLIWPERTESNGFWLLDVETGHYHNLCQAPSIQNLGLEHFYAAFGLGCSRNLRTSSAYALGISEHTFFLAHAVRARGSDGHQNVLWFSV